MVNFGERYSMNRTSHFDKKFLIEKGKLLEYF